MRPPTGISGAWPESQPAAISTSRPATPQPLCMSAILTRYLERRIIAGLGKRANAGLWFRPPHPGTGERGEEASAVHLDLWRRLEYKPALHSVGEWHCNWCAHGRRTAPRRDR